MIIDTDHLPSVYPTGLCYCGCGDPTDTYFISNHDRRAEAKAIRDIYQTIAVFVAAHGGGPAVPPRAPTGADGHPLKIGDWVTADSKTGRFSGIITAIHKNVAVYRERDGTKHSAIFTRFVHEPLQAGDKVTANIRGGPYPGSTITSVRSNGEIIFTDTSGAVRHGRPNRIVREH